MFVRKFQKLGYFRKSIEGVDGISLHMRTIKVPKPIEINVHIGDGVEVDSKNDMLYSTKEGRLRVNKRGNHEDISIVEQNNINYDIRNVNDPLSINGDLEVNGQIENSQLIETTGQIIVQGNVTESTVKGKESIWITENIASSTIIAGRGNMINHQISFYLENILELLPSFIQTCITVLNTSQNRNINLQLSQLVNHLLTGKEEKLKEQILVFIDYTNENYLDLSSICINVIENLIRLLNADTLKSIEEIEKIQEITGELYKLSLLESVTTDSILAKAASYSTLICPGKIILTGKGCVSTKIHTESVFICKGSVRGGNLFAKKRIEVNEAGSVSETHTIMRTSNEGVVIIHKAHPGTEVFIGEHSYMVRVEKINVMFRKNQFDLIELMNVVR